MMSAHEESRRRREPVRSVEFCPVRVSHGEQGWSGQLEDLSAQGAKIKAAKGHTGSGIRMNEEVDLRIKTPYGTSMARVKVLWAEIEETGVECGVEFTERSKDKRDPINCLIESAFC